MLKSSAQKQEKDQVNNIMEMLSSENEIMFFIIKCIEFEIRIIVYTIASSSYSW